MESYSNATDTASACLHGTLGYVHRFVVELARIELNVLTRLKMRVIGSRHTAWGKVDRDAILQAYITRYSTDAMIRAPKACDPLAFYPSCAQNPLSLLLDPCLKPTQAHPEGAGPSGLARSAPVVD